MLQKSKSKQVKLFKYALLIPIVLGMLIYTSCEKEKEIDALNLEQYTYTVTEDDQLVGELKEKSEKFISFLNENPDYVGWVQGGVGKAQTFSIHSAAEKVPEDLNGVSFSFKGSSTIKMFNESNSGEVPYEVIEQVPVFPGCEDLASNQEKSKCMSEKITNFVVKNFNVGIVSENDLVGRHHLIFGFKIDAEGNIVEVQSRSREGLKDLEAEAIRVIKLLPKMKPGKQRGEAVVVPYYLPIVLQVQEPDGTSVGVNSTNKKDIPKDATVIFAYK